MPAMLRKALALLSFTSRGVSVPHPAGFVRIVSSTWESKHPPTGGWGKLEAVVPLQQAVVPLINPIKGIVRNTFKKIVRAQEEGIF